MLKQKNRALSKVLVIILFLIAYTGNIMAQVTDTNKLQLEPKLIALKLDSSAYQGIFDGPPETVGMYSGLVTLNPGETVGHHNTNEYEEMLVIFSGEGHMIFENKNKFELKYGVVAYCPPYTEHDVINTGPGLLKYLYIASKTKILHNKTGLDSHN